MTAVKALQFVAVSFLVACSAPAEAIGTSTEALSTRLDGKDANRIASFTKPDPETAPVSSLTETCNPYEEDQQCNPPTPEGPTGDPGPSSGGEASGGGGGGAAGGGGVGGTTPSTIPNDGCSGAIPVGLFEDCQAACDRGMDFFYSWCAQFSDFQMRGRCRAYKRSVTECKNWCGNLHPNPGHCG